MRVTGPWDAAEAASFLSETVVPVRLATAGPGDGPWVTAVWFRYREGRLECATAADADLAGFLRRDDRVAFDVSVNDPPYRGVRGQGTATVDAEAGTETLRALIERYLGGTDSPLARRLLAPDRDEVRIRVEPTRLHTWDYTARMSESA